MERENIDKKILELFRRKITTRTYTSEIKVHQKQINRLIKRIKQIEFYVDEKIEEKPKIVINNDKVNRLELKNFVNQFEKEQKDKLDNFGTEILPEKMTEFESEKFYYRKKIDRIKSMETEKRLDKHIAMYCDSINLIGHLAKTLPKPSDPPEIIWNRLLKPIKEIDS